MTKSYCGWLQEKIKMVEGRQSNHRWLPSSALKFKGLL
jgi:hypothetical protein